MPKNFMRKIQLIKKQMEAEKTQKTVAAKTKSYDYAIEKNLQVNLQLMKAIFLNNKDIIFREFTIGNSSINAFTVSIDGLVDKDLINRNVLHPLMWEARSLDLNNNFTIKNISESLVDYMEVKEADNISDAVSGVLSGDTALFVSGTEKVLIIGTRKWEQRGVNQPESESSVRGPREGFTETLRINTSLIRRKIKDPELMIQMLTVGDRTRTDVAIVFINDIANEEIVKEVVKRVSSISIDSVLESGYIEAFINDAPLSLFPTIGATESPDKFAGQLLEGRVGILVDGTPFALTVPLLFIESLQVPEDYYRNFIQVFAYRTLRIVAFFIALFLPAIYISIINFHPSVLPIALLDTIASAQEGIPFPSVIETLLMLIFYEGLREAGVRIPRPIGQAVSIVGALILGDAVVSASLAGYPVVIVVALSGIMGFLVPPQFESILLLRIPFFLLSAVFGMFGLGWGFIIMLMYLNSLHSFGVPYFYPMNSIFTKDTQDLFVRSPWWAMRKRPYLLQPQDLQRIKDGQQPKSTNEPEGKQNE